MGDIFSKYSATSTTTVKKLAEEENSKTVSNRFADRLEISDGLNKIRIGPKHPGEEHFMHMRACHWITIEGDSGPQRRTVSNARVMLGVEEDVIEAYVNFCKERLADGDEDNSTKLKNLTDWQKGLNLSTSWMSYAKLIKGEKRSAWQIWEYSRPTRDLLVSEMVIEDEDEALSVDPFTHPKTGRSVLLTFTPKTKKTKAKTTIKLAEKAAPLSSDELLAYDKLTPIDSLPEFNYSIKDFELALEGLAYYDSSEEIELLDDEEFQEVLKKIKKSIQLKLRDGKGSATTDAEETEDEEAPFEEDEDEKPKKTGKGVKTSKPEPKKKPGKKAVEEDEDEAEEPEDVEEEEEKPKSKKGPKGKKAVEEEPEEDEEVEEETDEEASEPDKFDEMERRDLLAYKTKKGYDEVKVYKSDEDDAIRQKLRDHEASLEDTDTEEDEPEEKSKGKVKVVAKETKDDSLSLESIKARMAKRSAKK